MKRVFIVAVAMATMMVGAWSCAKESPKVEEGLARESFDAWVKKFAPEAYANRYKDIYIEFIEKGAGEGLEPLVNNTWLEINYTGKTFDQTQWNPNATDGDVFVTRVDSVSRLISTFLPTTHYANDFVEYSSPSSKLCEGLIQAFEKMQEGDSVRVYIPADKAYSSAMNVNNGYLSAVSYTSRPIMFEIRLAEVVAANPFIWERELIEEYAEREWKTDFVSDSLGFMHLHIDKKNPTGDTITQDSSVFVYYEAYFMDGFLAGTNIDTVASKWNVVSSESDVYNAIQVSPEESSRVTLNKVLYIAVPYMRKGEIADVVTVSTWALGDAGNATSTPEILPYQPLRYRIHVVDRKEEVEDVE